MQGDGPPPKAEGPRTDAPGPKFRSQAEADSWENIPGHGWQLKPSPDAVAAREAGLAATEPHISESMREHDAKAAWRAKGKPSPWESMPYRQGFKGSGPKGGKAPSNPEKGSGSKGGKGPYNQEKGSGKGGKGGKRDDRSQQDRGWSSSGWSSGSQGWGTGWNR